MVIIVFITPDKKFLYDGKRIKEVKKDKDIPENAELSFAKPMIVYDVEGFTLSELVDNYGTLLLGTMKLRELVSKLDWRDFILFVDHIKKTISVFVSGGEEFTIPYDSLEFIRYLLAKFHSGILLESASFDEIQMFSI
ncbi:hypothetical protein [Stygiolobus azoricus]|uniref:Uncharacterized protein n=1 Tax=Stygiolobus azoricus TaxID=41675 RepID=A0A650CNZ4_9CREN|nr:hypothetical protein [Stygiolobus azoricus]QGR19561.1 hypothetical protein D1868_05860 [Stygiolobus azoricus]